MKKEQKIKNIGIDVVQPTKICSDAHCPFHGKISLRGRTFTGNVIRNVVHKTATVEFQRQYYLYKYERYEKRRTRIKAHVPPCLDVEKGNTITIMESRPISKTKHFVAIEVLKDKK